MGINKMGIIKTDILTNNTYLDTLPGYWERVMGLELRKIFTKTEIKQLDNICLTLSGGHLYITDWECNFVRIFFINNKIHLDTFLKNLDYLNKTDWFMDMVMDAGGYKKFLRLLGFINNYNNKQR